MKAIEQYVHVVLFIFQFSTKWNLGFFSNFELCELAGDCEKVNNIAKQRDYNGFARAL